MRLYPRRPAWWLLFCLGCFLIITIAGTYRDLFPTALALASGNHPCDRGTPPKAQFTRRTAANPEFVYFFDLLGDFVKVDLGSQEEVAHGQIAGTSEVLADQPNFDGCVFCGVRSSRSERRLYAVLAKEAHVFEDETKHYRIVALEASQLKQTGSSDLGERLTDSPAILVKPDGKQLLASYQTNPPEQPADKLSFVLSIFELPSLRLLRTLHEETTPGALISGTPAKLRFTDQAYFGPDGSIYDRFDTITFSGGSISKSVINPFELLASSSDKQLQPYRQPAPAGGKSYFAVDYAESAAGKLLVTLNAGKKARQAALTIDVRTYKLSPVIKFPQLTIHTVHLTPDAKQVLVEEFVWRKDPSGAAESEPSIFRTGHFFIFSTSTGKEIREFEAKELAGFRSREICMSAERELAFYAVDGRLYALHLKTGAVAEVHTKTVLRFDQWTTFAFVGGP